MAIVSSEKDARNFHSFFHVDFTSRVNRLLGYRVSRFFGITEIPPVYWRDSLLSLTSGLERQNVLSTEMSNTRHFFTENSSNAGPRPTISRDAPASFKGYISSSRERYLCLVAYN